MSTLTNIATLNINDLTKINSADTIAEFTISLEDKTQEPNQDFGFYPSKVSGFFKQGAGRTKGAMCHATELRFVLVSSVSNYAKTREDFKPGERTVSARVEILGYERGFVEIDGEQRAFWEQPKDKEGKVIPLTKSQMGLQVDPNGKKKGMLKMSVITSGEQNAPFAKMPPALDESTEGHEALNAERNQHNNAVRAFEQVVQDTFEGIKPERLQQGGDLYDLPQEMKDALVDHNKLVQIFIDKLPIWESGAPATKQATAATATTQVAQTAEDLLV
jgi:hypothetical protein